MKDEDVDRSDIKPWKKLIYKTYWARLYHGGCLCNQASEKTMSSNLGDTLWMIWPPSL